MAMAAESLEITVLDEGLLKEHPSKSSPPHHHGSTSKLLPHSLNTGHKEAPGTQHRDVCGREPMLSTSHPKCMEPTVFFQLLEYLQIHDILRTGPQT